MQSLRDKVCFGVWGLRGGCVPSRALRPHSNQLTTSRARLEKSPLGRGLRRNNSSRVPSTPPPTATPSALLRVFTVLTLARNSSVMSTAMATRTDCPRPSRPTSAVGDRGASPASGGLFRLCTPPPANWAARRKVPASAGLRRERRKVPPSARAPVGYLPHPGMRTPVPLSFRRKPGAAWRHRKVPGPRALVSRPWACGPREREDAEA